MESIVPTLIQGGAVGIALAVLFVLYKFLTNHTAHSNDVIDRNTAAWVEQVKQSERHTAVLEKLCDKLDKLEK